MFSICVSTANEIQNYPIKSYLKSICDNFTQGQNQALAPQTMLSYSSNSAELKKSKEFLI